ncbi:hypothetical protein DVH24_014808 [Malus domestica]|uniref:Uncharacterized protein n=1 Tax=Malus domestica TaxID=3750 RepID=A0A498JZX1_MALDO|nr:hypothetical protein DVH24_014808 [Malus domestica]
MKTLLQYFFLLFLFNINTTWANSTIPVVHHQCIQHQQLLLLNFKKTLAFDRYISSPIPSKFISWNSSTDCCSWFGVTCSTNGHVVGLDISSQSISSGIDNSSSLFDLEQLQSLNLADNGFSYGSHIPSAIGKLTNLRYLNLSYNFYYFEGKIPVEISQLTRLVVLDISQSFTQWYRPLESPKLSMLFHNLTDLTELYLDGVNISAPGKEWCQAISSSLPNLRVLSLSNTLLSSPVDQSLAKLQSLSVIRLDHNYGISGPIPGFFANFSNLREFSWDGNNVSAPFPGFFANFSKLTSLSLSSCSLQGTFPKEIFQVPTLKIIDLSGNEELLGSLPEFPNNGSLRSLVLPSTNFSGLLPGSIGNLKHLERIELFNCSFTGSLPKSMENLTQLVYLDMFSNLFNGAISSIQWENLINLAELHLADNLLEGSIPPSLFYLPLLSKLRLSQNRFSGQLSEFSNASSNLVTLDLSFNNLEGPIPVSIYNFQGLQDLSLSSNNFSAFPFNGPRHLKNLTFIDLSNNSLPILYNGTNSSYSSFPQIATLNLASNKLREIPGFLRNQSHLFDLDLSANHIQGEIPHWIWSFTVLSLNLSCNSLVTLEAPFSNSTLREIDLHSNQLQGEIPYTFPFAHYLDYSNNHFCCSIPADIGDFFNSDTSFLSLSNNNLRGIIPPSICN